MVLGLIFAGMAALAIAFVVLPLFRRRPDDAPARADYDVAIYKDQLREVERDRARGVIDESQAAAARVEVERRLLAAAAATERVAPEIAPQQVPAPRHAPWRFTAVAALILLPAAVLLYLNAGAPFLAERTGRQAAQQDKPPDFATLLDQMEQHLADNPQDGKGWSLLARGYVRVGRAAEADAAQSRAMDLANGDAQAAEFATGFGQSLTDEAQGRVTQAARAAFAEALKRDPKQPQARFFLGLAKVQEGDGPGGLAEWQALLADTPADAPWRAGLADRVAQLERDLAAGNAEPAAQQAMIERMVEGLAARLAAVREAGGGTVEEWAQLGRSYRVLGRAADARDAYGEAIKRQPEDIALRRDYAAAVAAADGESSPAHRTALEQLRDRLPMGSAERAAIERQLKISP